MESNKQEKKNLLNDNPIASHGSWISKHSIAAGSPLHMGGSGKSPLDQRTGVLDNYNVQDISSEDTGADIYTLPATGNYPKAFTVVQDRRPESKPRYTPEQLAQRVDVKTGKALDYNATSGTVEMSGGDAPSDTKRYKTVNLDETKYNTQSTRNARQLKAKTENQLKPTNREYDTNTWSAKTLRENDGKITKTPPQPTYKKQGTQFNRGRKTDSSATMRNRNYASKDLDLMGKGKRLSDSVTKEQLLNFMKAKK